MTRQLLLRNRTGPMKTYSRHLFCLPSSSRSSAHVALIIFNLSHARPANAAASKPLAQGGGNILVVGTADLPPNTPVPGLVTVDPNAQHQQQRAETVKSGQPVRPIFVFDMRNPTGAPVIHNSPLR